MVQQQGVDRDWLLMMTEAKQMGIPIKEIQKFINEGGNRGSAKRNHVTIEIKRTEYSSKKKGFFKTLE